MTCRDCGARGADLLDFLVATPIWNAVMAGQMTTTMEIRGRMHNGRLEPMHDGVGGVVCLPCFDRRAREAQIPYLAHLLVFGGDCWQGALYDGPMPLAAPLSAPPAAHTRPTTEEGASL